jgi:hypothetical protein
MSNHRLFCSFPAKRITTGPLFGKLWNRRELSTSTSPEPVMLEETLRAFRLMLRSQEPGSKPFKALPGDILSIVFHYICQWTMFMPLPDTRGRSLYGGPPIFPLAYDPALDYVIEFKAPEGVLPEMITGEQFQYKNILVSLSNRALSAEKNVHVQLKRFNMAFIDSHRSTQIFPIIKLDCDLWNPNMEIGVIDTPEGPVLTLVLCGSNSSYANMLQFWLYDLNALLEATPAEDNSAFTAYKKCTSVFPYYQNQQRAIIYGGQLCYQSQFTTRTVPNASKRDPYIQLRREVTKYDPASVHIGQTQLCVLKDDDTWGIHPDMTDAPWMYLPEINRVRLMSTIHDSLDVELWNLHHKSYQTKALGTLQIPYDVNGHHEELWCFSVASDYPHVLLFSYRTRIEILIPMEQDESFIVDAKLKHDAIYVFRQNKTIDVYHYNPLERCKMIKSTVPITDNIVLDNRTLVPGH